MEIDPITLLIRLIPVYNCFVNDSAEICSIKNSFADLPELPSNFLKLDSCLAVRFLQFCQSRSVEFLRLQARERGCLFSAVRGPKLMSALQVHEQLPAVECIPCRSRSSNEQRSIFDNV
jgi:hypothetical protein